MIAKLDNFSEITKLPSVKSRIGDDIFSLFSKFRLSQTLSRLCMEKQCGYSASDLEHHCHHGYDNEFHEGIRDIPSTLGHRGADKGLPPELGIRQMPVK